MVYDLGFDCLLHIIKYWLSQSDTREVGSRLHEYSIDLIACLSADVVLLHLILCRKLLVQVLLDCLHVIEVDFVSQ